MLFKLVVPALVAMIAAAQPRQIAIQEPTLHQFEDGPPVGASQYFFHGDMVFISTRFAGYSKTEDEHIKLQWQMDAFDPRGVRLVPTKTDRVDVQLAPQDKDWRPKVRHDFLIPPLADPGEYKVVIQVTDDLGKTSATKELKFQVKAPVVETSETLVIKNFRFQRADDDGPALNPAVYAPGSTVWMRFDITGYKFAAKNGYHVTFGVEVLRASGKTLYSQPKVGDEKEEAFYPKRYVPSIFSLQLTPDLTKGEYTVVVRVRDEVGNQDYESRQVFQVQ